MVQMTELTEEVDTHSFWGHCECIQAPTTKDGKEADVLNAIILRWCESKQLLPNIVFANQPSKILFGKPLGRDDLDRQGSSVVCGTTNDEIRDTIAFINYSAREEENYCNDSEGKSAQVWCFQPSPGLITNLINGCPHGTAVRAFYYTKDDFILDRMATLQSTMGRVGPSNHTSVRCIEQGPTVKSNLPNKGKAEDMFRILTVKFQYSAASNPTGFDSIPLCCSTI